MTEGPWLQFIVQMGAFGLVAWLFFQTFKVTIPDMAKKFAEQLDRQWESFQKELASGRKNFTDQLETQRMAFREELNSARQVTVQLTHSLNKLTVTLMYHDATSKGVSPSTIGSPEELLKLLQERFTP